MKPTNTAAKDTKDIQPAPDMSANGTLMDQIFKKEDGRSSDLSIMERKPKTKSKSILISIIVLLLLAGISAILGFFVFNRSDKKFNESDVQISFQGERTAASGENVIMKITYKNSEKATLTDSTLNVSYPSSFTYVSATSSPVGEYHNQWSIGNLQPGEERTLEITGQLIGEVGSSHPFTSTLTYRPSNFNSEFSKKVDWEMVINSSTLNIEVKDAREVISGQPTTFSIEYTNSSDRAMGQIKLQPTWPGSFVLNTAQPNVGNDGNWLINDLKAGAKGTISVTGVFTGNPSDQQEVKIQVSLVGDNGQFQLQLEKSFLVLIVSQDIQMKMTVNNQTETANIDWGQTLTSQMALTNASDFQLDKSTITWQYELLSNNEVIKTDAIDWSTLVNPQKATRQDGILSWSANEVDQLSNISPGDSITLSAEVNLKSTIPAELVGRPNLAIKITPSITGQRKSGISASQFNKTGEGFLAKISSKVTLGMESRYYDQSGKAIGSGPFPPVVGRTTTYKIYLSLNNGANDINDVSISLSLPESITWVGQGHVDAGQPLTFDPNTRLVSWRLNKLPAWTGQSTDPLLANFSISISPVEEQIDSYIQLIPEASLKGTDAFTHVSVTQAISAVDTSLPNDSTGAQRGKVISQGD
ncbi:MAG: hypothetical protein WC734_01130 [Patescibacteria group bacterium]|jgi:hypothetical protein